MTTTTISPEAAKTIENLKSGTANAQRMISAYVREAEAAREALPRAEETLAQRQREYDTMHTNPKMRAIVERKLNSAREDLAQLNQRLADAEAVIEAAYAVLERR